MWRIKHLCLSLFWLFPVMLCAQSTDFSYQVILESQNQYNALDDNSVLNEGNRMQIDELSSTLKLYPILTFGSSFGEWANTLQAEGFLTNYNFDKDSVDFSFQELYARFSLKECHHWAIGKKRLDWGTGMVWNPTNFHVQKDPFRTQNRLEGIFLLSYTYLFVNGSLEVYVFPEKRLKDFSYAAKYNFTGERIDLSVSFLEYTRYQQIGFDLSYGGDHFTAYSEGAVRNFSKNYFYPEILAGASYSFHASLGARFEYRYRDNPPAVYDPVSVGKHSLFASADFKDMYDRYNFQLRTFYDPQSKQLILSPLFVWKKGNFQVELSSMLFNNALAVFDSQTSLLISCHF